MPMLARYILAVTAFFYTFPKPSQRISLHKRTAQRHNLHRR